MKRAKSDGLRSSGFSLIELLVVMVIIGLLSVLVMTGVKYAKGYAQRTRCAANLQDWVRALHIYCVENNGWMPGHASTSGNATPTDVNAWFNALPPKLQLESFVALSNREAAPRPGEGSSSLLICPSSPAVSLPDETAFFTSYGLNYWVEADSRPSGSIHRERLKLHQVVGPVPESKFALFADCADSRNASVHPTTMVGDSDTTAFRHNGAANVSFADGHVSHYKKEMIYSSSMTLEENFGPIVWNPDEPDAEDDESLGL